MNKRKHILKKKEFTLTIKIIFESVSKNDICINNNKATEHNKTFESSSEYKQSSHYAVKTGQLVN